MHNVDFPEVLITLISMGMSVVFCTLMKIFFLVFSRRMNDLREEIGMLFSLTGRMVRSWIRWAGDLVRMEEG